MDWRRAVRGNAAWLLASLLLAVAVLAVAFGHRASREPWGAEFLPADVLAFASTHDLSAILEEMAGTASRIERGAEDALLHNALREKKNERFLDEALSFYLSVLGRWVAEDPTPLAESTGIDPSGGLTVALLGEDIGDLLVIVSPKEGNETKLRAFLRAFSAAQSPSRVMRHVVVDGPECPIEGYVRVDSAAGAQDEATTNRAPEFAGPCFAFSGGFCLVANEAATLKRALATASGDAVPFESSGAAEELRRDPSFRWPNDPDSILLYCAVEELEGGSSKLPAPLSRVWGTLSLQESAWSARGNARVGEAANPASREILGSEPSSLDFSHLVPSDVLALASLSLGEPPSLWSSSQPEFAERKATAYRDFLSLLEGFDARGERWLRSEVLPNLGESACLVVTDLESPPDERADPGPAIAILLEVRDREQALDDLARMRRYYYTTARIAADSRRLREAILHYNFDALARNEAEAQVLKEILSAARQTENEEGQPGEAEPPPGGPALDFEQFVRDQLLESVPVKHWPNGAGELEKLGYLEDTSATIDPWGRPYRLHLEPSDAPLVDRSDLVELQASAPERDFPYGSEDAFVLTGGTKSYRGQFLSPALEGTRLRPCYAFCGSCLVLAAHRRWLERIVDVSRGLVPSLKARGSPLRDRHGPASFSGFVAVDRLLDSLRTSHRLEDSLRQWQALLDSVEGFSFRGRFEDDGTKLGFQARLHWR